MRTPKNFNAGFASLTRNLKSSKALMQWCCNAALDKFKIDGDTSQLQKILSLIENEGKGYIRKAAYLKWLKDHSPITMEEGVFKKIEGGKFDNRLISEAKATPFWVYHNEVEQVAFTASDVVKSITSMAKRYSDESKFAKGENLGEVRKMVAQMKKVAGLEA